MTFLTELEFHDVETLPWPWLLPFPAELVAEDPYPFREQE